MSERSGAEIVKRSPSRGKRGLPKKSPRGRMKNRRISRRQVGGGFFITCIELRGNPL